MPNTVPSGSAIAIGRRGALLDHRLDPARSAGPATSSISARLTTWSIDQCVAPPTSMYSMKRTSAGAVRPNSIRSASSSSLTPRMTTVSSFVPLEAGGRRAAMPREDLRVVGRAA